MVGVGDLLDVVVRKFLSAAIDQMTEVTRVDEQDFVFARMAIIAGAVHKPQRRRYLGIQKQFGGQVDDAVDQVAVGDQCFAYLAFTAGFAGECALGQHHACLALRVEMIGEVLQPREVGVARRRCAILPAAIAAQQLAAPVANIERRVALATRNDQRASAGTKKTFSALYSSLSSGSAPAYSPAPACNLANISSKESEMYFRKIKPITTCLYSAASMFLRSLSAAFHSCFSSGSSLVSFAGLAMVVF